MNIYIIQMNYIQPFIENLINTCLILQTVQFKLEDITSGGTYPPNQSTIIPSAPAVMAAVNLASTAGSQRRISSGPNARKLTATKLC